MSILSFLSNSVAGGFQLNEHGARAMGLGGAFAARAYDPSAMYFNPAGLGFQTMNQIMAGTTLIMPDVSFYGPYQFNSNAKTEMVSQLFTPINLYATYHLSDDLHFGIGVNNPYGLGTKWPEDWAGKFITTQIELQSFFVTPTVAYRLSEDLSVGIGVNYVFGDVSIKSVVSDPFDPHAKTTLSLDASAFGFNAGILYKATADISVGASYRSSVKLDATGTADFAPARSVYPKGDVASSITLPATGYFGVAWTASENLVVEADYQYVGWSSYDELVIDFKADGSTIAQPKKYEDTYILRAGAEYTMDGMQLRAGYFYDHSPVQTKYVDPMLPDANRNGFNIGIGYTLTNSISVDAAYLLLLFDERRVEQTEVNFDGTYQSHANLIAIGLTYTL
jgi:long-chain fatty acid transport protein